jgi:class 3 adenylate cyclase
VDEAPETRYVAVGDADVAYQVVGDGPADLLFFAGLGSHVDLLWDYGPSAAFFRRLASFSRLILFDRRGAGASDAVPNSLISTWEAWAEDARAVLGAAGSERAYVFAEFDAGPTAVLLAAMDPALVQGLVLANTSCRYLLDDDYPAGMRPEAVESVVAGIQTTWGTADSVRLVHPNADPELLRWTVKLLRASATPRSAAAQYRYILTTMDVRQALPLIQTPTVVLHTKGNPLVPLEQGRYLAEHIDGARFVELSPEESYFSSDGYSRVLDEVAELLTGQRLEIEVDRILTTVMFTDIVGSTPLAASLGDHRWRTLLDSHDRMVRDQLRRFRGREIKTTGDGFLASFDGPARAILCAQTIASAAKQLGIEVRSGLHTGECELRGDDVAGIAVNVGARIGALAGPSEVLVSSTVRELVLGSGLEFDERGRHVLKGVPGDWRLFAVGDDGRADARPVHEVDADTAARTPGPQETMRARDRVLLATAEHAPRVAHALGKASWARLRSRARSQ